MRRRTKGGLVVLALIGLFYLNTHGGDAEMNRRAQMQQQVEDLKLPTGPISTAPVSPSATPTHKGRFDDSLVEKLSKPKYTTAQEQAISAAKSYLDGGAFSRQGLLNQLSSSYGEGFTKKDALFAVNHVKVNWYVEAVQSARSYLDSGAFSRKSLIDQLHSPYGEGFTYGQAQFAATKVGLH